jgi:hypothetical protein
MGKNKIRFIKSGIWNTKSGVLVGVICIPYLTDWLNLAFSHLLILVFFVIEIVIIFFYYKKYIFVAVLTKLYNHARHCNKSKKNHC